MDECVRLYMSACAGILMLVKYSVTLAYECGGCIRVYTLGKSVYRLIIERC